MRANARRMESAVAFVAAHPGASHRQVIAHVLSAFDEDKREKPTAYKQAASVVERIVKDRYVRQEQEHFLYPWDAKLKSYAEALERALVFAPTQEKREKVRDMVCEAWCSAGDHNRAQMLLRLHGPV